MRQTTNDAVNITATGWLVQKIHETVKEHFIDATMHRHETLVITSHSKLENKQHNYYTTR